MDKTAKENSITELTDLLRARAEIIGIMRGPNAETDILLWLLKRRGHPIWKVPGGFEGVIAPSRPRASELSRSEAEAEVVRAGRALRASLRVLDGGGIGKKPR